MLVFGTSGQVARELQNLAPVTALGREEADLSDPEACASAIERHKPEAVINAAAYTAVDRAEDEPELATRVNGEAPGAMAAACAKLNIPFVHISTDYVFEGSGAAAWHPDDPPAPQNVYGHSKLLGEQAIRAAGGNHAILRTSWVFSAHGANFAKTMLRLAETRDALKVVDDQVGGPTPARDIARTCLAITEQLIENPDKAGTYHYGGAPDVSWCGFAREIFAQAGCEVSVEGIPSSQYPTPAKRPFNSRMDCTTLTDTFGIERPDWRQGLGHILKELETTR
ncbi:dTDP-4-dehydrorhamnose reductase [Qipengyuania sp. CAU 1752]